MSASQEHLEGGSVWDDEVYRAFREHVVEEDKVLSSYRQLAGDATSPDVAYLVNMIMEDEKRHHRTFEELATTVRQVVDIEPADGGVPDIPLRREGHKALRNTTEELLRLEREDAKRLRQLRRTLRPVAETTIWPLLVEMMELDTKKHILILKHILAISGGVFGE
ncbi:MAG TPA: hypothetical protein VMD59_14480 [Acidimicrobiales bacterium]|nr:hypothetical protein [Acidimicrobiales bacterium]